METGSRLKLLKGGTWCRFIQDPCERCDMRHNDETVKPARLKVVHMYLDVLGGLPMADGQQSNKAMTRAPGVSRSHPHDCGANCTYT